MFQFQVFAQWRVPFPTWALLKFTGILAIKKDIEEITNLSYPLSLVARTQTESHIVFKGLSLRKSTSSKDDRNHRFEYQRCDDDGPDILSQQRSTPWLGGNTQTTMYVVRPIVLLFGNHMLIFVRYEWRKLIYIHCLVITFHKLVRCLVQNSNCIV